jgi:quercetin dioxygenase-like cupin family protein
MEKHETLLVLRGLLLIDTTHNKEEKTYSVKPGEAFVVAPGFIHSLRAKHHDVVLIEASTPSYDTDSIRIKNGD